MANVGECPAIAEQIAPVTLQATDAAVVDAAEEIAKRGKWT